MNEQKSEQPLHAELLTPQRSGDITTADIIAMSELAKNIIGPFAESQQAVAKAQIEAVRLATEGKERLFVKALPLIWFIVALAAAGAAYLLHLGKEAVLLDFAKVAIGGALGYFAAKRKD